MDAVEEIGRKLELGIFRTSRPIKDQTTKDSLKKKATEDDSSRKSPNKDKYNKVPNSRASRSRTASQSPTKSPDPLTQTLFMRSKNKRERECSAEARIEKRSVARESAQKTVPLVCGCDSRVTEKVSLTIRRPTEQPPVPPTHSEATSASTTTSCAHLVERKLTEIARQAEELAHSIRRATDDLEAEGEGESTEREREQIAAEGEGESTEREREQIAAEGEGESTEREREQIEEEQEQTATQQDVDSLSLDPTADSTLLIEVAPPVVKASEQLSLTSPASPKQKNQSSSRQPNKAASKEAEPTSPKSVNLRELAEATKSLMNFVDTGNKVEKSTSQSDIKTYQEIKERSRIPCVMSSSDIRPRERESLADRLTKGIHDITQGSTDRLQKWKSKLHTTGKRSKDQSEPPPINRPSMSGSTIDDVIFDWSSAHRSPRPLHPSKSATNAVMKGNESERMEHRTLRNRDAAGSHGDLSFQYLNMNSIHSRMNTYDSYAKSNCYDLPPPSRFMESGVKPTHEDIIRPIAFRPVGNQFEDRNRLSHAAQRHVIRGDLAKSASHLPSLATSSSYLNRSKPTFPASTSFSSQKPQENEYDTVPDYVEKEKMSDFGSSGSDYGCFLPTKLSSSTVSSGTASSHLGSPNGTTNKKSHPSLGSVGRSISGVHVTPSPSDSGIVDFESMMRDKENELREVRNTMEQNEEIIVKVYQEKERLWKEELEQLRTRLAASERGEHGLRAQLAGCQRQTDSLSRTVDGLREEKTGLLRKCFQLERELAQLKLEVDKPRKCEKCTGGTEPVPAPRHIKDGELSIRGEVCSLRSEVATLKEALNGQIQLFTEERQKWERENNSCRSVSNQVSVGRDRLI